MTTKDRFAGCILAGAIGDAWGSSYENKVKVDDSKTYYLGQKPGKPRHWSITDDTQLTLATCEALSSDDYSPRKLAEYLVKYYRSQKLRGIGASTLKSILELEAGQHWSQAGRTGDYAAGNGAAMRIAPFAFFNATTREDIVNACKITHNNSDAYVSALAVHLTIRRVLITGKLDTKDIFEFLIKSLPDTNTRDRFLEINCFPTEVTIADIAKLGNNGYSVNSIPFAIFSATKIAQLGLTSMYQQIIDTGGDADTNASIAGQIAGTFIGEQAIDNALLDKLRALDEYDWIMKIIEKTKSKLD
jgi:ADP-ribosylglycohydrolase